MIHLILGGARSGKSSFALQQAQSLSSNNQVLFIATATAFDDEMTQRIQRHQDERPAHWQLAEIPLELAKYLLEQNRVTDEHDKKTIIIDCLTLWLNNQLFHSESATFEQLTNSLIEALVHSPHDILLIANEVGLGVVPMGEVSRRFVDYAGWLNQAIADIADQVTLVTAGIPMRLKGIEIGSGD